MSSHSDDGRPQRHDGVHLRATARAIAAPDGSTSCLDPVTQTREATAVDLAAATTPVVRDRDVERVPAPRDPPPPWPVPGRRTPPPPRGSRTRTDVARACRTAFVRHSATRNHAT